MIDNIEPELLFSPPKQVRDQTEKPFIYNGLPFYPKWNHKTGLLSYWSYLDNLLLQITGNRLKVKNSWHKYHKGNNYSDYNHSEVIETYYKLEQRLGECLENATVKKLAYGVVIKENPELIYPNWLFYKTKTPDPMKVKGRIYGAKFDLTDYTLKGYNKTFEVWRHNRERIENNLFRLETEVDYMRHLRNREKPIYINTLKDLFKFDVMQSLCNDLLTKYQNIEKLPPMDLKKLSLNEIRIFATMQNKTIRDHLRVKHNKTYKRDLKQFKQLLMANNDYYAKVEEKILQKMEELINN